MHRARDVDNEDVLARIDLRRCDGAGRLDQGKEEVLAAFGAFEQGQAAGGGGTGQAVLKNEVPVVGGVAVVAECDFGLRRCFALDFDAV